MSHGSGGTQTRDLINDVFRRYFDNPALNLLGDSAIVDIPRSKLAFTTDSFVVKPLRFPGGDIGKLAICGTVNDLAVAGARPLYISVGFIIEEGLELSQLEDIAKSMAETAKMAGALIVTGDTKVVEKGSADGIFINTAGIGEIFAPKPMLISRILPTDAILINGTIADHGMAIMTAREGLSIRTEIASDCAPLNELVECLLAAVPDVHFMRDATRGGLAAVLCEVTEDKQFGIEIDEKKILTNEATASACELLGIEPLHVANEGKLVAFVPKESVEAALAALQSHPLGREASIIGHVTQENAGKVSITTEIGSKRLISMPSGEQLPRIC